MAEEMKQELSAEEAEQLALVENDRDALSALVDDLSGHNVFTYQFSSFHDTQSRKSGKAGNREGV